jgi:antitoxin Phd
VQAWRLQDAKSQFSALVDNALRGVPQHVTRRGKQAVVVLSEQDFEALQRGAANRAARPASFIDHLLAMPVEPAKGLSKSPARKVAGGTRLDLRPREIDWS